MWVFSIVRQSTRVQYFSLSHSVTVTHSHVQNHCPNPCKSFQTEEGSIEQRSAFPTWSLATSLDLQAQRRCETPPIIKFRCPFQLSSPMPSCTCFYLSVQHKHFKGAKRTQTSWVTSLSSCKNPALYPTLDWVQVKCDCSPSSYVEFPPSLSQPNCIQYTKISPHFPRSGQQKPFVFF